MIPLKTKQEILSMSDSQLKNYWLDCGFPFDNAQCGNCLFQHQHHRTCHSTITRLTPRSNSGGSVSWIRANIDEIYALRKFFASEYAWNPPDEQEPTVFTQNEQQEVMNNDYVPAV